jgi:hypothetical protein
MSGRAGRPNLPIVLVTDSPGLEQKPSVAAFVHGWFSPTVLGR